MNTLVRGLLRYTLDLFEPPAGGPVPRPDRPGLVPEIVPGLESKWPIAHTERGQAAPDFVATDASGRVPPQARVVPLVQFSHPRGTRQTRLGNALVGYEFKRGKRRTIGFRVGPDGLAVSAPRWTPLPEVEAALQQKADWIVRKLDEARLQQARQHSQRIDWADGVCLPFLGDSVRLVLDPAHGFAEAGAQLVRPDASAGPAPAIAQLRVALSHSATPEQIRDAVQAWLMRQATRIFTERLDHFAPQLQVQWRRLSLSNASTRWGSARLDGSIRLNWRLVHCKPAVIDYVVAHELSHLRVMDHSPRFWDTVRAVVPDYAAQRQALKNHAGPRWD